MPGVQESRSVRRKARRRDAGGLTGPQRKFRPWQLGTVDLSLSPPRLDAASLRSQAKNLSRNGLSDDSVARIADRLRQLHVRVTALPGTGFLLRPAAALRYDAWT